MDSLCFDCFDFASGAYRLALIGLFSQAVRNFVEYSSRKARVVVPRTVLPNGPKGILRIIPEDFTDLSVIYKVSDKETAYLMLGPIRFMNSDCEPNCEYDFSSLDKTLVRLCTLKKLKTNDEVLVKYSDDLFSNNECKCRTCSVRESCIRIATTCTSNTCTKY